MRTIKNLGEYYQAKAVAVNADRRTVTCADLFGGHDFEVAYDFLVVAAGCKTNTFGTSGVDDSRRDVCFLKHLYHARKVRNRVLECFERASSPAISEADRDALLSFVVVGAGATSCEFTSELSDFVREDVARWYPRLASRVHISLVEAGPKILSAFDDALVEYYSRFLRRRSVDLRVGIAVQSVDPPAADGGSGSANLSDGSRLNFGLMVWSAGLAPVNFVQDAGFQMIRGRILVDEYLRVPDKTRIFAAGDCAVQPDNYLPPTASVAEQHAAYLAACFNDSYANLPPDAPLPVPKPVPPAAMPTIYLEPLDKLLFNHTSHFRYVERGSMASMGMWRGIADLSKTNVPGGPRISGFAAFLAWRGAYLSKQLSLANMILIPMFWFKSWLFGRDISRF